MRNLVWAAGMAVFAALLVSGILGAPRTASAYNIDQCRANTNTHWESTPVEYDRFHGNFPSWWQNEIDDAANTWNNDGGADFSFDHSTSSDHDWTKRTRRHIDRIAETNAWIRPSDCAVTDISVWFNTRYTFEDCGGRCWGLDTYDVRSVSLHEFGHWLVLDHTNWWRFGCVMKAGESGDRTLCDDDKAGIQAIYGTN